MTMYGRLQGFMLGGINYSKLQNSVPETLQWICYMLLHTVSVWTRRKFKTRLYNLNTNKIGSIFFIPFYFDEQHKNTICGGKKVFTIKENKFWELMELKTSEQAWNICHCCCLKLLWCPLRLTKLVLLWLYFVNLLNFTMCELYKITAEIITIQINYKSYNKWRSNNSTHRHKKCLDNFHALKRITSSATRYYKS